MINVTNLCKTYTLGHVDVHAVDQVSLTINEGEFVAIMGPSGSGKSTLMHILGLLDNADAGTYELEGKNVTHLNENESASLRSSTIGFIFQQFNLLTRTPAYDNVALPLIYYNGKEEPENPDQLLETVGLGDRKQHKPSELSGGQQQRVAIARALVNRPKLIFADEPTGNLDSKSQNEIMTLLGNLHQKGLTIILVTHEEEVARHATRIIKMRDGKVISDEKQTPILYSPDLSKTASAKASLGADYREWREAKRIVKPRDNAGSPGFRKIRNHVRQSVRALLANKVRTLLSTLGILIGVAAVIAMLALGQGAKQAIQKQLSSLGTNLLIVMPGSSRVRGFTSEAGNEIQLTSRDITEIQDKVPHVSRIAPIVSGSGRVAFLNKNWRTRIQGSTAIYANIRNLNPEIGRFFYESENQERKKVVLIGATVARELFTDEATNMLKNPIGESIQIKNIRFQVIGILPEKGGSGFGDQDNVVVIPIETAMKRVLGKTTLDSIEIEVDEQENIPAVQDRLQSLISETHQIQASQQDSAFQIRNLAELQKTFSQTSNTMSMLLAVIAAISLLVGGIGIMNIMLVSVTERTREIGLRKAIGAKPSDILMQFLIESMIISISGGLFGILLGVGISELLSLVAGWTVAISGISVATSFIFASGIGIIFGLWPAQKAARLNPIEALRYE